MPNPTLSKGQAPLLFPVAIGGRPEKGFRDACEPAASAVADAAEMLPRLQSEDLLTPIPGKAIDYSKLPGGVEPVLHLRPHDAVAVLAWWFGTRAIPVGRLESRRCLQALTEGLATVTRAFPRCTVEAGFATPIGRPGNWVLRLRPKRLLHWAHGVQEVLPTSNPWHLTREYRMVTGEALSAAMPTPVNTAGALRRAFLLAKADVRTRSKGRDTVADLSAEELRAAFVGVLGGDVATSLVVRGEDGRFYWRPKRLRQVIGLSTKAFRVTVRAKDAPDPEALAAIRAVEECYVATDALERLAAVEAAIRGALRPKRQDDRVTPAVADYYVAVAKAAFGVGSEVPPQVEFARARRIDPGSFSDRLSRAREQLEQDPTLRDLLGAA